jgi:hypothetical protein
MPAITCPKRVGEALDVHIEFIPPPSHAAKYRDNITADIVLVPRPAAPHRWLLVNPIKREEFPSQSPEAFAAPCGASLSKYVAVQLQDVHGNIVDVCDIGGSESGEGQTSVGAHSRKRKLRMPTAVKPVIIVEPYVPGGYGRQSGEQMVGSPGRVVNGGQQAGVLIPGRIEVVDFNWDNPKLIVPENVMLQGVTGVWNVTVRTQRDFGANEDGAEGDTDMNEITRTVIKRKGRPQHDDGQGSSMSEGPSMSDATLQRMRMSAGFETKIESSCLRFNLCAGKPKYMQVSVQLQPDGVHVHQTAKVHMHPNHVTEALKFGGMLGVQGGADGLRDLPAVTVIHSISVCVMDAFGNILPPNLQGTQLQVLKGKTVALRMENGSVSLPNSNSNQKSAHIQEKFFSSQQHTNIVCFRDVRLFADGASLQVDGSSNALILSTNIPDVDEVRIPVSFAATNTVIALSCTLNPHANEFRAGDLLNKIMVNVNTEDGLPLGSQFGMQNIRLRCLAHDQGADEIDLFRVELGGGEERGIFTFA